MKKLFLSLLMTGIIAGAATAQDQKHTKTDPKEWDKKVKTELNLTPDQVTKYDALSMEYSGKMEAIMKDANLTKELQKEKKMELKKEKQARLFEFFTPEQQTKYTEMMDKKKAIKQKET
ncbi:MAG TPA: hypothetical protein VNA26_07795 [Chitinophagaceae bacterium]|nr:hypothetical protein [Chitinophagaceae bacterium]